MAGITFELPDDALIEALAQPHILEAIRGLLEPDQLDMREACAFTHCSEKTILRALAAGELKDNRPGRVGHHRFTRAQLNAWRGLDR